MSTSAWADLTRPPLREAALRRAVLDGRGPWTSLDVVPATGSTNADLAARARAGIAGPGAVLTTDDQHSGRGRRERVWSAPPRAALAVSALVRPDGVPRALWSWLPLVVGLGVADALTAVAQVPAVLKWPNDVLLDGLKVCGVLVEVVDLPAAPAPAAAAGSEAGGGTGALLGIGVNVLQRQDELAVPTATSLLLAGASTTDRDTVLRAVLRAVGARYTQWVAAAGDPVVSGVAVAYRERCDTIGRPVRVELPGEQRVVGVAEGVDDDGRLLVRPDDARPGVPARALAAGDVVHVLRRADAAQDHLRDGMI